MQTFFSIAILIFLIFAAVQTSIALEIERSGDSTSYCYNDNEFPNLPAGSGFTYKSNTNRGGVVYIHGDVREVLVGKIPSGTKETMMDAKGYVGFGAATIGGWEATGEAFYTNHLAHVRSTDNSSADYFKVVRSQQFRTPFSMFVVDGDKGDGEAVYRVQSPSNDAYTLLDFFTDVSVAMETSPYCFYGVAKFSVMDGIAVSKAPIYNEKIEDGGYYEKPPFQIPNLEAFIFGCAANFSTVKDSALEEKLKRCLYVNMNDPVGNIALQVHTHGLAAVPCSNKNVDQGEQGGVYHFLTNSTITEIRTNVFKIDTVDRLQDFSRNGTSQIFISCVLLLALFMTLL